MSLSRAATTLDTDVPRSSTSTEPGQTAEPSPSSNIAYNFSTSLIVRAAVAAGVIILVLTALVLFFNISQWLRNRRRRRQRRQKFKRRQMENQASMFEVAAWNDKPGGAPVDMGQRNRRWHHTMGMGMGRDTFSLFRRKKKDPGEKDMKVLRRGGANAYNVFEWEGVAQ